MSTADLVRFFPRKPVEQVNRVAYRTTSPRYRACNPCYLQRISGDRVRFIDSDGFTHDVQNPSITFSKELQTLRDNPALYEIVQEE